MARTFVLLLAALFCLTAQSPPPAPPPAASTAPSDWTSLGAEHKDLSFRMGCVIVPTAPADRNAAEIVFFKNDGTEPYDFYAGFSLDGTTAKIINYHIRIDPGAVTVTFFGFSRPCGADKQIFWSNVYQQKGYMTPQQTADKNAAWLSCTMTSHTMMASNGASLILPQGSGETFTLAYEEKILGLLAYDPQSKTLNETNPAFAANEVSWFYQGTYQYHLDRKTLALTRTGTYKEESNLENPPDITITDNESGQCQKTTAPPLSS